jgi:hypothetical protein
LWFDLKTKGGGLALAYIEQGLLNLDGNPELFEFDSMEIALASGSVTKQRRETRPTCGAYSSARQGREGARGYGTWAGPRGRKEEQGSGLGSAAQERERGKSRPADPSGPSDRQKHSR